MLLLCITTIPTFKILMYHTSFASGKHPTVTDVLDDVTHHPNDVYIAGYSDSILRFVADRGMASVHLTFNPICVCVNTYNDTNLRL